MKDTSNLNVRLPAEIHRLAKFAACYEGRSLQEWIKDAIGLKLAMNPDISILKKPPYDTLSEEIE